MELSDKIIIGSTIIVAASTITMLAVSKKYNDTISNVHAELQDINYILSRSNEDIIIGNREISEGNAILRTLVKQTLGETSTSTR